LRAIGDGFSDGFTAEEQVVASGNVVTRRYRLVGTNDGEMDGCPATGRKIDFAGCTVLEVEDGRVPDRDLDDENSDTERTSSK